MSIVGIKRKKLRLALKQSFSTYAVLRRFLLESIGKNLDDRTHPTAGVDEAVDVLMDWLIEDGLLEKFVNEARAEHPNNAGLREIEEHFGLTFDPLADVQPSAAAQTQIAENGLERVIIDAAGFPSFDTFLSALGVAEYRVCVVSYKIDRGTVCGTGFLIADDLILTNRHVIAGARHPTELAGDAIKVTFNFRSRKSSPQLYTLQPVGWLKAESDTLDYAILKINGRPGQDPIGATSEAASRGYFRCIEYTPSQNEPLLILQHPYDKLEGTPSPLRLTIGFASQQDENAPHVVSHSANTSEGSSGSPVFSCRLELFALHYWGGENHNQAISIGAIREDLAKKLMKGVMVG